MTNTADSILLGRPIPFGAESYASSNNSGLKRSFNSISDIRLDDQETFTIARGSDALLYEGDSHLMTIAPTGAGKGRSVIIPNLLNYAGPVIVVDPKGENYHVTARYRREVLGHRIVKLDPFGQTKDGPSDSFNPFDILTMLGANANDEARMLGSLIMVEQILTKDPFWENWAGTLLSGIGIHLATTKNVKDRSFVGMRDILFGDDVKLRLAKLLDNDGKIMDREAYQDISTVLSINADATFAGVLSSAQQYLRLFGAPSIRNTLSKTSFPLRGIFNGDPITVYIIIPPSKLVTHQAILRLWVGALLTLVGYRKFRPAKSTLFVIDEAAQLGHLTILQTAKTLLRGYGLQTWSFWQDFSQIQTLYQTAWRTIVNNCAVVQVFGARNHMVAREFSDVTGISQHDIREIGTQEQILIVNGAESQRAYRFDYLGDAMFASHFDPNPLYDSKPEAFVEPEPQPEPEPEPEPEKPAEQPKPKPTFPPFRPSPFAKKDDDDDDPFAGSPPPPRPPRPSNPFELPPLGARKVSSPPKKPAAKLTAFTVGTVAVYVPTDPKIYIPMVLRVAALSDDPQPLALSNIGAPPGPVIPSLMPEGRGSAGGYAVQMGDRTHADRVMAVVYLEAFDAEDLSDIEPDTEASRDEKDSKPKPPPKPIYAYLRVTLYQLSELLKRGHAERLFDLDDSVVGVLLAYGEGKPSDAVRAAMREKYLLGGPDVGYTTVRLQPPVDQLI